MSELVNIKDELLKKGILKSLEYYNDRNIEDITIKDLGKLQSLYLSTIKLKEFEFFKYLENLKNLYLDECELDNLDFLCNLVNLEKLTIRRNKLKSLHGIEKLVNLKELYARENPFLDISSLEGLSITNLCLCETKLEEEKLEVINSLGDLEVLCLEDNGYTNLPTFKNKSLKKLWLSRNKIQRLDFLQNIKNLIDLNLYGNGSIYDLENLSNVEYIYSLGLDKLEGEQIDLIEHLVKEKELQFLKVYTIELDDYNRLDKNTHLKIMVDNDDTINEEILSNNKIKPWYYNDNNEYEIYQIFCVDYVQHYIDFLDNEKYEENHIMKLKQFYLNCKLFSEEDFYNYKHIGYTYDELVNFFEEHKSNMDDTTLAKYYELFAYILTFRNKDDYKDEIEYLEKAFDKKKTEFVCYKLMYYNILSANYEQAYKYYNIAYDNNYIYNYYFLLYEMILAKECEFPLEDKMKFAKKFKENFGINNLMELQISLNLILFEVAFGKYDNAFSYIDGEAVSFMDADSINGILKDEIFKFIDEAIDDGLSPDFKIADDTIDMVSKYENRIKVAILDNKQEELSTCEEYEYIRKGKWLEDDPVQ